MKYIRKYNHYILGEITTISSIINESSELKAEDYIIDKVKIGEIIKVPFKDGNIIN